MAVIEKNLGPVSAYAIAVAEGYEGTEEQWAAEIANASNNAQAAAASATAAAASATAAAASASDADAAKTAAQAAAETASAAYGTDLIANNFATDTPYTVGQYVIYDGGLYRFASDHPAGVWIGTDAVNVPLADDVADLKSALSATLDSDFDTSLWSNGTINGNSGIGNPDAATRIYTIKLPDDIIAVSPINGYSLALYAYASDSYVGVWTGSQFQKTTHNVVWFSDEIVFDRFGDYVYRVVAHNADSTDIDTSNATNILFVKSKADENAERIDDLAAKALGLDFSSAQALANGSDIDSLTTYGSYRVTTAASAATMTGVPPFTNAGYRLIVIETTQSGKAYQIAFANGGTEIKYRVLDGGQWRSWASAASLANVESLIDAAKSEISSEIGDAEDKIDAINNQILKSISDTSMWESGSRNGNSGYPVDISTRIRTKNVLPSDIISVSPNSGYAFAVYAYDTNGYVGVWTGSQFQKTTHNVVWFSEEKALSTFGTYTFNIVAKHTDDSDISVSAATNITFTKKNFMQPIDMLNYPIKLRIMQYNIGKFNMGQNLSGSYRLLNTDNLTEYMNNYKGVFGSVQPDIIGIEEFENEMTIPGVNGANDTTISMNETLFDRLYPYNHDDSALGITSMKAIKSKYVLNSAARTVLNYAYTYDGVEYTGEFRVIYASATVNEREIGFVVNAFPNSNDEYPTDRNILIKKAFYQAAVDLLANYEYAFIICDQNALTPVADEILTDVMIPAGFNSAHGSYFPWQNTWQSQANPDTKRPLDNIYYKSAKTQLVNFTVLWDERPNLASDHVPVYADFILE